MDKEFTIIIDGKENKVSAEKAKSIIKTLKDINNCYVESFEGHNVYPWECYDNDVIRELATMLGADLEELDGYGEKAWWSVED